MASPTLPRHHPASSPGTPGSLTHGQAPDAARVGRRLPQPQRRPFDGTDPLAERDSLLTELAQLRTAMASRATIEQAKGALMLLVGCGEDVAFNLLAHISSHTHRKLREVAAAITASAAGRTGLPDDVRAILRDACPPRSGCTEPARPT